MAFLNGEDRNPHLAALATEVLTTMGHMTHHEIQAIRGTLDAEVVVRASIKG